MPARGLVGRPWREPPDGSRPLSFSARAGAETPGFEHQRDLTAAPAGLARRAFQAEDPALEETSLLPLLLLTLAATPSPDPCAGVLPAAVLEAVAETFPGYRVARSSDYGARALRLTRTDGFPCPGIASNDVDGDGSADYAFFVLSGKGMVLLAAARVPADSPIRVEKLMEFGRGVGRSFVFPLKAGKYSDMYADSDFTPDPGRVRRYTSKRPGFSAGTMEASEIAFFFTGRRWVHMWLSD